MAVITKKDLSFYRKQYEIKGWEKISQGKYVTMPLGVLKAISALCDEVERLRGWKK